MTDAGQIPPIDFVAEKRRRQGWCGLTDLGNGERFVELHGLDVRYCTEKRKWLVYGGAGWWKWDDSREVQRRMHDTVRQLRAAAAQCPDKNEANAMWAWAQQSESTGKINAALEAAQPYCIVHPDQLDADPWLLCVANGVLDLRTLELREHDRRYLMTRHSPAEFILDARSDVWQAYLDTATGGDKQLQQFLRRVAGYLLTGSTLEKCFFMLYGPPNTGKSVFVDALTAVMGSYAQPSDFGTWCVQKYAGGNRGDLVRLAGSRLVTAVETNEGTKFDGSLIKGATGGEKIVASAKYEAEVEIIVRFKLLFAVNDCPRISEDDAGMFERVRRIPWNVVIPAEKRDKDLRAKLSEPEALSAILAWQLMGLKEYVDMGELGTCRAVEVSNAQYRSENDITRQYIDECLDWNESYRCPVSDLRTHYENWCRTQGVKSPLSAAKLGVKLDKHGAVYSKSRTGARYWKGFRCIDQEHGSDMYQEADDGRDGNDGLISPTIGGGKFPRGSVGENAPSSPSLPSPTTLELFQQNENVDANFAGDFCPRHGCLRPCLVCD